MKDENMLNRRGAETQRENQITEKIIGSAIEVHAYLKLYGRSLGLLVNFNVPTLKDGVKRIVNQFQEFSASQRLCGDNL